MATLNPDALQVETMSLSAQQPSPAPITDAPTTQRTFERDCTMPGLCPETW